MKSKLVKYPFSEKKYRWDTHEFSKEFEYSWDKSVDNNYSTITPYVETEPFDSTSTYSVGYGIYGEYDTPSYSTTIGSRTVMPNIIMNYGYYDSNLSITISPDPATKKHSLGTITSSNCYITWGLTQQEFQYLYDNNIDTNRMMSVLIEKNHGGYESRINSNNGVGTSDFTNPYSGVDMQKPLNVEFYITKANNEIVIEFGFDEKLMYGDVEFPRIYHYQVGDPYGWDDGYGGESYTPIFKEWLSSSIHDELGWLMSNYYEPAVENVPRRKIGYLLLDAHGGYQPAGGSLYYIYGETYDPRPMFSGENIIPFLLDDTKQIILVGSISSYTSDSVYHEKPTWEELGSFSKYITQQEYESLFVGEEIIPGTNTDCLSVKMGSGFYKNYPYDRIGRAWFPLGITPSNEPHYFIDDSAYGLKSYGWFESSTSYGPIQVTLNTTNSFGNTPVLVKESDLLTSGNYTKLLPMEIKNAQYVLKPNLLLIGDQTNRFITVPDNNDSIFAYSIGDPTDQAHLNQKQLQINAPCEYDSQGNVVSRTWLTYNSYTSSQ